MKTWSNSVKNILIYVSKDSPQHLIYILIDICWHSHIEKEVAVVCSVQTVTFRIQSFIFVCACYHKALSALNLTYWHDSSLSAASLWWWVAVWINVMASTSLMCLLAGKAIFNMHQKLTSQLHHEASRCWCGKWNYPHSCSVSVACTVTSAGLHEERSFMN